jgi:3',5'-cyclic-AMP phosphodiesterase
VAACLMVQISDLHLTTGGSLPPGVQPWDNLLRGLRLLEVAGIRPDIFLLTGDLADRGEAACYDNLAGIIAGAAAKSGAGIIYVPGNHDDRDTFRRHLLGGAGPAPASPAPASTAPGGTAPGGTAPGSTAPGGTGGPINQTHWRGGLRIIALDSTVPGEDHGILDDQTLGYLKSELGTAAPDGTVVALHHPPIPSPIRPMAEISLRDPERLRDAIAGSDVRIIVCGHNHHPALGTLGSIPVWVSPASAYLADTASTQVFHGVPGTAFSRIDLSGDGPMVTVIPVPLEAAG